MTTLVYRKRNYLTSIRHYVALSLVLFVAAAFFGYKQFQKLTATQNAITQEQVTLNKLQKNVETFSSQYGDLKKSYDVKFVNVFDALQYVLPSGDNYTDLARLFDQFFQQNNSAANPFFISDLKFGTARNDTGSDFSILPVTMTITSSKDNFMKFLKYIEDSGTLQTKTRLMDVRSISVNFTDSSNNQNIWNVSLVLNAYFQKSKTTPTTPKVSRTNTVNNG